MKLLLPSVVHKLLTIVIVAHSASGSAPKDSVFDGLNSVMKSPTICACQILRLTSFNHRSRNYALLAQRSNRKSYSFDIQKAKLRLEREKKRLGDFFYDKPEVLDGYIEPIDCNSLFFKLKKKHRSLILYDILDADIKK